jgi:hypothetical protein
VSLNIREFLCKQILDLLAVGAPGLGEDNDLVFSDTILIGGSVIPDNCIDGWKQTNLYELLDTHFVALVVGEGR